MTASMPEVRINPETERTIRLPEKIARTLGGYVLGFTGLALEFGGVASFNPIASGLGAGLVYAGHRVVEPAHDQAYGEHTESLSKFRRAARFNVSLLPTYIGFSMLSAGIFGATVNGTALTAGERIATGAIGFPIAIAGGAYERHLHEGGSLIPGLVKAPGEPDANLTPRSTLSESLRSGFRRGLQYARQATNA